MNVAQHPAGDLVFAAEASRSTLSRLAKAGRAVRIAAGVYAVGATLPPEAAANEHRFAVIARYWPGAVLCGHTALADGASVDGRMYVAHPEPTRRADLRLPGLTVAVQVGPAQLPGDMGMPKGLAISGRARLLVENVNVQGRPLRSRAGTRQVEDRIDSIARTGGSGAVRSALGELDVIAPSFDPRAIEAVRVRLAAVLGTVTSPVASERLRARLAGLPYDAHRSDMITRLVEYLMTRAPEPRPAGGSPERWSWLPFFEAYFSNFIEGTRFGVDEARRIAINGEVPASRPVDAHDVAATYRLTSDHAESRRRAAGAGEFIELLSERHRILMAARPNTRPGELKQQPNYAGGYQFVEPALVPGTLRRGFDHIAALADPYARAVAIMALITECHPFDDGNGRLARLMANAELTAAGQVRIIVPTIYRNNYLVGLNAFSNNNGVGESLDAVLGFAQRWSAAVDWTSFEAANAELERCNAYLDPAIADADGRRLLLPAP